MLFMLLASATFGQRKSAWGLAPVSNKASFLKMVANDSTLEMVELKTLIPDLVYDLRYASKNNFTGIRLYPKNTYKSYMRIMPSKALAKVADELRGKGLAIKVWDAYRPYSVTIRFWNLIHDERYVANPSKGSGHNRGIAIDLSLVDLLTGKEIDMPTGFDNFSDTAYHGSINCSVTNIKNREMLRATMEKFGFTSLQTEWWHYSWPNPGKYDVLDLSFKQLGSTH